MNKGKTPAFADAHPIWLRTLNEIRPVLSEVEGTFFSENPTSIHLDEGRFFGLLENYI